MSHENTPVPEEQPWGPYEQLRPAQIEAIRSRTPLAYLPWGALEWHSYHNPIGLDGMLAHGLCKALARRTGGVVLPPVYIGTDTIKPYKGFGHTLEHSAETVRRLGREFLEQLADEGYRVIILITGHCGEGQTAALQAAADAFSKQHPETGVWMMPAFAPIQDVHPSNHAAFGETALQMLFDPRPVDLSLLPPERVLTLEKDGIWGDDPRPATAEAGAAMLALFVERALPRIQDLLTQHTP